MSSSDRVEFLEKENGELKRQVDELVVQLMRRSADFSDSDDTLRRWKTELEIVASKDGHNLCHIWIPELLQRTLGHTGNFQDPKKMTRAQFCLGCKVFQDCYLQPLRQGGNDKRGNAEGSQEGVYLF